MKQSKQARQLIVLTALSCSFIASQNYAAVRTWTGGGPDAKWNTGANWSGSTAPGNGDLLVFNGSTQQNNTNDINNLSVGSITFSNGGFNLHGNALTVSAGIFTNLAGINIISLDMTDTVNNTTWNLAPGSELQIAGSFIDTSGTVPLANLTNGGTLRVTSTNFVPTSFFTQTAGTVIFDGAMVSTLDGYRLRPPTGTAVFQITNNASFTIGVGGNLRLCQTTTGGSSRVDMASGLVNIATTTGGGAGDIFVGEAASTTTIFNQNGGLVEFTGNGNNRIAFANGDVTANGTYNLNGGTLLTAQIAQVKAGSPGGTFNFNGGTLKPTASSAIAGNLTTFFQGVNKANIQSGGAIIDTTNLNITIGQALPGMGGLTKLGTGTLTLSGVNSYSGTTTVSNGTLAIATGLLTGGGGLVVGGDGAILSVTNTGSSTSVSSMTLGSSGTNTTLFTFPSGNPGSATFVAGTLAGNGYAAIKVTGGGLTVGTIQLINYTSASGLANVHLVSVPPGVVASLVNTGSSLQLNITSVGKALEWSGAVDADWNTTTANWFDLGNGNNLTNYTQPGGFGDLVTFDDGLTANSSVNLALAVSPVSMTLNNNSTIYSFTGPGKITGVGSVTKGGFQPVTFGTANDYSGGTTLNAGIIYLGADQALGTGAATLNLGTIASDSATARTLSNSIVQNADLGVILGDTVNTGTLDLAGGFDLAGGAGRTLNFNSDVVISGSLTNGGILSKTGPGAMIIKGNSTQSALALQNQGDVIVDGGTFNNFDGWRLQCLSSGDTMRLVITNGGVFNATYGGNTGNLRVGLAGGDNSANNILDISGTVNLTPTSAAVNGNNAVSLGLSGANDILYLRSGGLLVTRALYGGSPGNAEAHFMGGTIRAIANDTGFISGLTNAFMEDGGLIVDTTNFSLTVPQPLLAFGTGGLTKIGSGTLTLSGASTYTGATLVNAGKLVLGTTFVSPSAITVNANSTLAFQQSGINAVEVASVTAGSGASSAIEADLAVTNAPAGMITNLVLNGSVAVNVAGTPGIGQFPLFGYGTISGPGGLTLGTIPEGTVGHLVTNTLGHTIDIVITGTAQTVWTGNLSGTWDTVTTNWTLSSAPAAYAQNANVLFNDSASTFAVSLAGSLTPSTMVVSNSAQSYTFSGSGNLGGSMTLVKNGTNSTIFSTVNSYSGATTINAGTLLAGADTTFGAGTIYVTNGGALDFILPTVDDPNVIALQPVVVSGSGVSGAGALLNSSANNENNAFRNVTLAGDTTIDCISTLGIRTTANTDPGLIANGHKLTKVGAGQLSLNGGTTTTNISNFWFGDIGNIDIQQGRISFERHASLGNSTNTITVESGATLQVFSLNPTNPVPITNSVVLNSAALEGTGATVGDTNTLGCPVTVNGTSNVISSILSTYLVLNGPITGAGSVAFSGTNILGGNNTYTGNTVLSNGVLTVASGASLTGTADITTLPGSTLDVSALSPWTLGAGQSLGGSGTVNGSVMANGTLAPGSGTGTLAVNGSLTLNGNLLIEVNKALAQSNDMASVSGALSNAGHGLLTVTNLNSGLPLAVGDKFTLFNQPVANGGTITVAGGGVTWTNNLAVDGSISVVTILPTGPTNSEPISVVFSAGNLNLSWHTIGWNLEVQTNSLAKGLGTNWVPWPNSTTTNTVSIPVTRTNPAVFFRLFYP